MHLTDAAEKELEGLLDELRITNRTVKREPGSKKGDNYLGVITKVEVTGTRKVRLIVKSAPQLERFRSYVNIKELYRIEVLYYEKIFEEFILLQKEMEGCFSPWPRLYRASLNAPDEFLMFQDMNAEGYVMKDRRDILNLDHCLLVMKYYGRFHALSMALRYRKPDVYSKLVESLGSPYFGHVPRDKLGETVRTACDQIVENLDEGLIVKLREFQSYPENGLLEDLQCKDEHSVFCHGDCWTNNFLFRYEDRRNAEKPTDLCILDFQLGCCASPAVDLSYFLFTNTDKEMRSQHHEQLLRCYHDSLTHSLAELRTPGTFSYATLQDHMKRFSRYGLMMALIVVPLMMSEDEEVPDFNSSSTESEGTASYNVCTKEKLRNAHIAKRLQHLVTDFERLGYFR